jgi:hypothetical protein
MISRANQELCFISEHPARTLCARSGAKESECDEQARFFGAPAPLSNPQKNSEYSAHFGALAVNSPQPNRDAEGCAEPRAPRDHQKIL